MTRYVLIEPAKCEVRMVETVTMQEAYRLIGLISTQVDHGTLVMTPEHSGFAIVVDEFSLMQQPPDSMRYFQIGDQLYAGNAVVYAFDSQGETINMPELPAVLFFKDVAAVEYAIKQKQIRRPSTWANDICLWEWNK